MKAPLTLGLIVLGVGAAFAAELAQTPVPVLSFLSSKSNLGFLLEKDSLIGRADSWKVFLDEGEPITQEFLPKISQVQIAVFAAQGQEELDSWKGVLARLEDDLCERLYKGYRDLGPEEARRVRELIDVKRALLLSVNRRRNGASQADTAQLDTLKTQIKGSGLDAMSLASLYDRMQGLGTISIADAFNVGAGGWSGMFGDISGGSYPAPKYIRALGSMDVPTPAAGTADEATVLKIARDRGLSPGIVQAAYREARRQGVDYRLVMAVIRAESDFNPNAKSSVGARGLMQIMPDTGRGLGVSDPSDLYNPTVNLRAGVKYLKQLWSSFSEISFAQLGSINPWTRADVKKAIAAYNAGPGAVEKYGSVPPYRETRDYVVKVLRNYVKYREMFPD
ncbi:MAG: lytic transglycosylase domain-containing protein [Elusimicrobiota bacterium]